MSLQDFLRTATIFPLHPIVAGRCGCGNPSCANAGKHPAIAWKNLVAGEQHFGSAGHGIATGERSGVFVVDEDVMGAWPLHLIAAGDEVTPTLTVKTAKGRHFYYRVPEGLPMPNSVKELGMGLDTRGNGGFVVCPGSPHASGAVYVVTEDMDPAPAPRTLLAWLASKGATTGQGSGGDLATGILGAPDVDTTALVRAALVAAWPADGRHVLARALTGAFVRSGYSPDWIAEVLPPADDPGKRAGQVTDTVLKYEAGEPIEGWPTVSVLLGKEAVERISAPLEVWATIQMQPYLEGCEETRVAEVAARKAAPIHEYIYELDHGGGGGDPKEKRKVLPAELSWILSSSADWAGVLRWNELKQCITATRPPLRLEAERGPFTRADARAIVCFLDHRHNRLASDGDVSVTVQTVAKANRYDPVKEYLESLPDAPGTLDKAFEDGALILDNNGSAIHHVMLRKQLIACVARTYQPGCKVDTCLVLAGKQDKFKSTLLQVLFSTPFFKRISWSHKEGEMTRLARGAWAIELDEMDGIKKAEVTTLKAWLSRGEDVLVPKYEENSRSEPRRWVPFGTSNETEILRDSSGERRWWVIPVEYIDIAWWQQNRDALWGEMRAAYLNGETHWMTAEEDKRAVEESAMGYKELDVIEGRVAEYLKGKTRVDPVEVACYAFARAGQPIAKPGDLPRDARKRVTNVLRVLGCTEGRFSRTDRRRAFHVPDSFSTVLRIVNG